MVKTLISMKMSPELRERLEGLANRVQILIARDRTHRDANLSELLTLGAETLAYRLERGMDALEGSESFHGSQQVVFRGDKKVGELAAPLASSVVYGALLRDPRPRTEQEEELLERDASLLEVGLEVQIRGRLFTDPRGERTGAFPVGAVGHITRRGGRGGTKVKVPGQGEAIRVHPYDLIPASMA